MSFTVAIIGRPNVGKSTLFNRLVGRRLALVDDLPGVTRDRREGSGRLGDLTFTVIDTAGLETRARNLTARMQAETAAAIGPRMRCSAWSTRGTTPVDQSRKSGAALGQACDSGRQQE